MHRTVLISLLLTLMQFAVQGQDVRKLVDQQMDMARKQMNSGNYDAANKTFRQILAMKTVLPHDLSYLFAETLYMVGQFENSDNFLKRYTEITGKGGNYTEQAEQLRELLNRKLNEIKVCNFCDINGYRLVTCSKCSGVQELSDQCYHCHGYGGFKCHICLGKGVIIEKTDFSTDEYKTCYKCQGTGIESCPVCEGKKILVQKCSLCLGSGYEASKTICDHHPHDLN